MKFIMALLVSNLFLLTNVQANNEFRWNNPNSCQGSDWTFTQLLEDLRANNNEIHLGKALINGMGESYFFRHRRCGRGQWCSDQYTNTLSTVTLSSFNFSNELDLKLVLKEDNSVELKLVSEKFGDRLDYQWSKVDHVCSVTAGDRDKALIHCGYLKGIISYDYHRRFKDEFLTVGVCPATVPNFNGFLKQNCIWVGGKSRNVEYSNSEAIDICRQRFEYGESEFVTHF
tara:strand:+ start:288 stop:974 length:687 start_codon:yes stop_codon:yes gene_type:complete